MRFPCVYARERRYVTRLILHEIKYIFLPSVNCLVFVDHLTTCVTVTEAGGFFWC